MSSSTNDIILTNAKLVLEDAILDGTIVLGGDGTIAQMDSGTSKLPSAIDCGGDYVLPGLVELHTDNVERHFVPRPRAYWPNAIAAVMAHDSEIAGAGITTVYDALSVGDYDGENSPRRELFAEMVGAVQRASALGIFRVEHRLHLRCELSDPRLMETLEPVAKAHKADLVSLMDHTPGQRPWRDVEALRTYMSRTGLAPQEVERTIRLRIEKGSSSTPANWRAVLDLFASESVTLATHDDTTIDDIDQSADAGIAISEFPCSLAAAQRAHARGMTTIGGAPNVVRGGSHSGNVAMEELASAGVLDALSSDYVPSSLLQAPFLMAERLDLPLYDTLKTVTQNPARMVGLDDRGVLALGKRADVLRVRVADSTPFVQATFVRGRRVS